MKQRIQCKYNKGFTLMELMICVVLIGTIAAFAIPNYQKAIVKGRVRNAILNLKTIHGANAIFKAKYGAYSAEVSLDLAGINNALSINIIDNDLTYAYSGAAGASFTVTASWAGGTPFTVLIDENPVTATNPCCSAGACSILPAC